MLFMFGMDFREFSHQHRLVESLLSDTKKKEETVVIKENINMEDISF